MADSTLTNDLRKMDIDSDEDYDLPQGGPASNITQRRRAQKALFEAWLISDAAQEQLKTKAKTSQLSDAADEDLSIQSLMTREGAKIIKNPREYQLELFERAKQQNTIAVLDTGSGKTLIAVLLLRWVVDRELELCAAGAAPKMSFFLVASVNLAFQQFSVLTQNLDYEVARITGSDSPDNWSKERWLNLIVEKKVIVCTADILLQSLSHSYITMRDINLLIFDEAHHTKKNHAYARIIKDFYLEADLNSRPRIFGMTASPVDAKSDVVQAANELEILLHSRIATTQDMSLTEAVKKPTEHILRYHKCVCKQTRLMQAIEARYGDIDIFKTILGRARSVAQELGEWCADQYLTTAFSEQKSRIYENHVEQRFYARTSSRDVKELDQRLADVRAAIDYVTAGADTCHTISSSTVSPQINALEGFVREQYSMPSSHRCIVFVERRATARLLCALFQHLRVPNVRPAFLVGGNASEVGEDTMTSRQQVMTLIKFRKGETNCLFATSVAEEGLDVPDCNLVIRFAMSKTMIQYVQSRGRARKQNSKFIHMLEIGNSIHQQMVAEIRYQETAMRTFCQTLPEDRQLIGSEDILEELTAHEKTLKVYTEPSTGAKLTYGNAMAVLSRFASAIPIMGDEDANQVRCATYELDQGMKFKWRVTLPLGAPVRYATGQLYPKKHVAKCSAAFELCIELRRRQYMNEHLMPAYQKKLPAMRNALLAANMKKKGQYLIRTKPSVWEQTRGSLPTELWVTIIDFPDGLERKHRPVVFLTRTRMPRFPAFPIFLNNQQESKVVSAQLDTPLKIDEINLRKLSKFTLRIFKDVFSKTFEEDHANFSYWLAPATVSALQCNEGIPASVIDWHIVDEVCLNDEYKWTPEMPNNFLVDKFLVDRWDGGRKCYSIAVDSTLKPLDPVPENSAKAKWDDNILEYTVSLWKKARDKAREEGRWDLNQPVMEAEKILTRRNMLATPEVKETTLRGTAYLCPQPLRISALPTDVVASVLVWPAIIYRFDAHLIALEACEMVGVVCEQSVALAAITKDSDNSGDHDAEERINFQKGMGENYERLEFIGDTFLKTATSISTYINNPHANEFEFHVKRMLLLCNKNLYEVAVELKLYEYIRSLAFSRRLWYPEGLKLLEGKGVNKVEETSDIMHALAQKTIADVCEALIGAAFVTHDKHGETWDEGQWENAVRAVTKLATRPSKPMDGGHSMQCWNDYRVAYEQPSYVIEDVTASQKYMADKVELEHHSYHFKYPRLLRSAFTHSSQPHSVEKIPDYQRLEFLGDALLDMASVTHLFYRFPGKDPQWLTEHKMALVSNKFLGAVCVNVGFHKFLRHSHPKLQTQIHEYAVELVEARETAGDKRDYWTTVSDPPKCLPDIVEAFVGAMFIDSDFDYNVVQDFFNRHMKWYFEDMSIYDTFANNHPCTHLHNMLRTTYGCQDFRLMAKELPPLHGMEMEKKEVVAVVMIHDKIVASSKGMSGRYARLRAAKDAIKNIEGLAPMDFQAKFDCPCRVDDKGGLGEGVAVKTDTVLADCGL